MYIIPEPLYRKEEESWNSLGFGSSILVDGSVGEELYFRLRPALRLLQQEICRQTGLEPELRRGGRRSRLPGMDIRLCLKSAEELLRLETGELETPSPEEAYALSIGEEALIGAADFPGFLYGIQTLRQIIRQQGAILPVTEIKDAPKLGRRGLSLDVTRGRVPTLEELKRQADTLSFYKMNELQLYVEHSFAFSAETEVWRGSDPLTAEEILELDAYCRQYNIDLVPSLASFGHLYELLQTRSYSELCELPGWEEKPFSLIDRMAHHTVDVSNEKSFEVLADRIREYGALFSSKYFNICADETFDLCAGKSRELGEKKGVRRVYLDFLKRLCEVVRSIGKTPMFWGDVLLEQPELLAEMPAEAIILNWEYSPEVTEDKTRLLSEAGVQYMYLCPGVQSWNRMINSHSEAYRNISGMCANAHKYHARGVLNTEWGDLGHPAHPEFSTVGQIYGAAFSWSDRLLPEEEINKAISVVEYGDKAGETVDLFKLLGDLSALRWWNLVRYRETAGTPECVESLDGVMDGERYANHIADRRILLDTLAMKPADLPCEKRACVSAYILMGEGEGLLEDAVDFLKSMGTLLWRDDPCGQFEEMLRKEFYHISCEKAAALEEWFAQYKRLWRSVSKESELNRVGDIIFWYADRLRKGLPDCRA